MSSRSRSHKSGSNNGARKPVRQSHMVEAFGEVPHYGKMPKLDNVEVDTVIEKLNEYYDAKNQCDINSSIIKNFANFLAIYISAFTNDSEVNATQFNGGHYFTRSFYNNKKLIDILSIDVDNLDTSVKAWTALHKQCIDLISVYAEKSMELEMHILTLQGKLRELTTQHEDTRQTHLGGGRKKKYSLKKKNART